MHKFYLTRKKEKLELSKLNLDGTHSYVKNQQKVSDISIEKSKTSNVLVLTDSNGIPFVAGGILSGNHNDLYDAVKQFAEMIKKLKRCEIVVENSVLNTDK